MRASNIAAVIGLGISGVACTWLTLRFFRKAFHRPVKQWQYVGKLKEITLFPIKSTAGIALDECDCVVTGIRYHDISDRQFVLMADSGKLYFAGAYPQMLGIHAEIIDAQIIRFTAAGMQPLEVNIEREFLSLLGTKKTIETLPRKGFTLRLIEGDAAQHKWFSKAIHDKECGVRLYLNLEPLIHNKWWHFREPDFFPIMVLHQKSIEDLNKRLSKDDTVQAEQFRGNLLIDACDINIKAFDEDHWKWLKIGDHSESVILQFNSYCYRCILPNISVQTLERNRNNEPLRTLKSYRILDNPEEPVMGVYYNIYRTGVVHKNDKVYVQY